MGRWDPWNKRQAEIDAGADADLFRDNRKKTRWSWVLFGSGVLICFVTKKAFGAKAFEATWPGFIEFLGASLFLAGAVLSRWARTERHFLNRPDPEKPPSIIND